MEQNNAQQKENNTSDTSLQKTSLISSFLQEKWLELSENKYEKLNPKNLAILLNEKNINGLEAYFKHIPLGVIIETVEESIYSSTNCDSNRTMGGNFYWQLKNKCKKEFPDEFCKVMKIYKMKDIKTDRNKKKSQRRKLKKRMAKIESLGNETNLNELAHDLDYLQLN